MSTTTKTYFMRKLTPPGEIKEYVFSYMDYEDNTLTLQDKITLEEVNGIITFADEAVTLTTRSYVNYEILAFIPDL